MKLADLFFTLQGEAKYAGEPTVFVRTAFCVAHCTWCDTGFGAPENKDWLPIKYDLSPVEVLHAVSAFHTSNICLTGGEPLADPDAQAFLELAAQQDYHIDLETSGLVSIEKALPFCDVILDVKCPSSGEERRNVIENLPLLRVERDQLKFVIADVVDYEYAKHVTTKYRVHCEREWRIPAPVLFSPCWDQELKLAKELAQWILADQFDVRLNLQLHKLLALA